MNVNYYKNTEESQKQETNSYKGKDGSTAMERSATNKLCQTTWIQVRCIFLQRFYDGIEKRI